MEPPARESVKRINPHLWILGSNVLCSKTAAGEAQPLNTMASWQDGSSTFHLLPRDETFEVTPDQGDSAIDRIKECGTGGGVWRIGSNAICKVKGWAEGRQLEATTISFVRENFADVPVPEVLHSWIDRPFKRTFLIMKRVHAKTLETIWPDLSADQRSNIAEEIARHCSTLAARTSSSYQTVSGCGVLEYWLMGNPPASNPSWLPMTLGPFTFAEWKNYMTEISTEPPPELDGSFYFYHPDLGPTNIMVWADGTGVAAIIDWEAAAYFPRFWVATKPASTWPFYLETATSAERHGWAKLLVSALETKGFVNVDKVYLKWDHAQRIA